MSGISRQLMLTIDQISQLTGVRKSTLRYWEKSFEEFLKPARTSSNRRKYSLEDLDRVKAIHNLLENEHLTACGVRLKLQKMASPAQEGGAGSKAKARDRSRGARPSGAEKDSAVQ